MNKKRINLIVTIAALISLTQATELRFRNNFTSELWPHTFESSDTAALVEHTTAFIRNPAQFIAIGENQKASLVIGTHKLTLQDDISDIFLHSLFEEMPDVVEFTVVLTECHFIAKRTGDGPFALVFQSLIDPDFELAMDPKDAPRIVNKELYQISELPTFNPFTIMIIYAPSHRICYREFQISSDWNIFLAGKERQQHEVLQYFYTNSEKLAEMFRVLTQLGHTQEHNSLMLCLTAHAEGEIEETHTRLAALPEEARAVLVELQLIPAL